MDKLPVIYVGGSCDGERGEVEKLVESILRDGSNYRYAGYNVAARRFMYVEWDVVINIKHFQESRLPFLIHEWEWE